MQVIPALSQPDRVLACAEAAVRRHVHGHRQRQALRTALRAWSTLAPQFGDSQFVALLVYAGFQGDDTPAIPLAAALGAMNLGFHLLDDLNDGELSSDWEGYSPPELTLTAATLICALPQLILAELDTSPACLAEMQRTLAQGLLRMSAGQYDDLASTGSGDVRVRDVEASVIAKSGECPALSMTLAAQFAGAPPDKVAACWQMGLALGTGCQIASDCYDLFQARYSSDLANGTRTFPIAQHLQRQRGEERARFLDLLERAREERAAQEEVRRRLQAAGERRRCALIVEIYRQRALRALHEVDPREPARSGLRMRIDEMRFLSRRP